MHFCAVGYSRPDGQASDHWTDVEKLTWEPEFARYVRDSFAPVGVMIDFWADEIVGSQQREIPVAVINDLETPYTGDVRLRLVQGEQTLVDESHPCRVKPLGREVFSFPIDVPADMGSYRLVAEIAATGQSPVTSLRDFSVITEAQRQARAGIAVGKPVSASSSLVQAGATAPEASVDENMGTTNAGSGRIRRPTSCSSPWPRCCRYGGPCPERGMRGCCGSGSFGFPAASDDLEQPLRSPFAERRAVCRAAEGRTREPNYLANSLARKSNCS